MLRALSSSFTSAPPSFCSLRNPLFERQQTYPASQDHSFFPSPRANHDSSLKARPSLDTEHHPDSLSSLGAQKPPSSCSGPRKLKKAAGNPTSCFYQVTGLGRSWCTLCLGIPRAHRDVQPSCSKALWPLWLSCMYSPAWTTLHIARWTPPLPPKTQPSPPQQAEFE